MAKKTSLRSRLERRAEVIAKNKRKLKAALNKVPRVPPGGGVLGLAVNLLASQGDTLVDLSTAAFTPEAQLQATINALEILERKQETPLIRSIVPPVIRDIAPTIQQVEELIDAADPDELENTEMVDALVAEIKKVEREVKRDARPSGREVIRRSKQFSRQFMIPDIPTKKKRKVSGYQKEFGIQLKKLKKKHPRTPVTRLMKRAHAATRKARK